ncbi:hypothetical protein [Martelella alba]|uniref:Uncharacterized protein n=1 Tax=Martelella alba TaxID=2590451 RepID=A0ABY2SHA7_9HYPH|nr:hypothetical protein [Martelella alba]TKI03572.1 hypothetical protein FCN80_21070 [Martelella alba]
MPRKKEEIAPENGEIISEDKDFPNKWVLAKNFGLITHGRNHRFFEAGTEFNEGDELIGQLIRQGAKLEKK